MLDFGVEDRFRMLTVYQVIGSHEISSIMNFKIVQLNLSILVNSRNYKGYQIVKNLIEIL